MRRHPHIALTVALVVVIAIGAVQGGRIDDLREKERFYRWLLAEATRSRLLGDYGYTDAEGRKLMDKALFDRVLAATEPVLPDVPLTDDDYDDNGQPLGKLVRVARDETGDDQLYAMAASDILEPEREDFLRYLGEKKLAPVDSTFDAAANYEQGAGVNLSNIFFGFRKLAANLVWLQVDKYWHEGGIHRMLPLMRTCVTLDPNFVDAYLLGAWHLAYNQTAKMMETPWPLREWNAQYKAWIGQKELYYYLAIDFIKDGIRKNPRNYKLYFDLGYGIYNLKMRDYANAVKYLSEAIRHRHDKWVPRMLYHALTSNEQYEEAIIGWEGYLKRNPTDTKPGRFILKNKGLLAERRAEEALELAKATDEAEEAKALRAKAEEYAEQARHFYEQMSPSPEDLEPFAKGRVMRMKAGRLMEEGSYIEAIAILENARWESNSLWDEASDLIIEAKQLAGIPLSVSEKKAVLRKQEAEKHKNRPPPQEAQ